MRVDMESFEIRMNFNMGEVRLNLMGVFGGRDFCKPGFPFQFYFKSMAEGG